MIILNSIIILTLIGIFFLLWSNLQKYKDRYNNSISELAELEKRMSLAYTTIREQKSFIESLYSQRDEAVHRAWEKAELEIKKVEEKIRADAIAKSKQVQKGFAAEHFAPFQMEFNPRDYNHLGNPVDYIVFAGSTAIKDGTQDHIDEVLFLDIKTGNATLNTTQRRIRDAILDNRVNFATWNPDTNELHRYEKTK